MADDTEANGGRAAEHVAGDDQIIVLRPVETTSDVVETSGVRPLTHLVSLAATIRRRPLASVASIVAAVALAVAATQLGQRGETVPQDAKKPSPTAAVTTPPVVVTTVGASPTAPSASPTGPPRPTITRLAPVNLAPVDLVVGTELLTTSGELINLSWAGRYPYLTTVAGGWLVRGDSTLWHLDRSGTAQPLLWQIDWALIGRNGRVAWVRGSRVGAARVQNGVLVGRREVDARGYHPMWIIGDDVVMGLRNTVGDVTAYDLWRPGLGAFVPEPHEPAGAPLGVNHGGTALLGVELPGDGPGCLVEINPRTFSVIRRACVISPPGSGPYVISPDGRWMLMDIISGAPEAEVMRIDLNRVFRDPVPVEVLAWRGEFGLGDATWLNLTTLISPWAGVLRQIDLNKPNVIVEIPLDNPPSADQVMSLVGSPP